MPALPLRQNVAQRWTLYARAAAALAGLVTAVIFLLPRHEPNTQQRIQSMAPSVPPPAAKERRSPTEWLGDQDWTALAPTLDTLDAPLIRQYLARLEQERRRAAEEELTRIETAADSQPVTRGGFPPPWRYIGSIREGERFSALIVSDMTQRFVQEGFELDGYTIARIEADRMIVMQGRNEHTLRLVENPLAGQIITGMGYPGTGRARAFPERPPERFDAPARVERQTGERQTRQIAIPERDEP